MTASSLAQFFTVVIIFIFVLMLTFFVTRYIANYQKVNSIGSNIEIIETYRISPNKYIQIIKIGKKYVSVVVCKDTVTKLTDLSEEEIVFQDENQAQEIDFKELLSKFKKEVSGKK
ncbi:MAG: flagellar biosynthetic protein FliO [Butyrivibrio sp.]|nr:flagellar biosynthetic protein FliO [Butyrivibrio sp.]